MNGIASTGETFSVFSKKYKKELMTPSFAYIGNGKIIDYTSGDSKVKLKEFVEKNMKSESS